MKSSHIRKFLFATLVVPMTMGALAALATQFTQTNAVQLIAEGPVPLPGFDGSTPPPSEQKLDAPLREGPVPWPQSGKDATSNG